MAHHADLFINESLDEVYALVTTFEFDRFRAAFFNETQCVANRIVVARVKCSVRHVGDEQRALHGATYGLQVDQDLFESHRHGVAVSEHDIPQAVADKYDVDSSFIDYACSRIVVSGQTNQSLASLFAGSQRRGTNLLWTFRLQVRHVSALFTPRCVDNWIARKTESLAMSRAW